MEISLQILFGFGYNAAQQDAERDYNNLSYLTNNYTPLEKCTLIIWGSHNECMIEVAKISSEQNDSTSPKARWE